MHRPVPTRVPRRSVLAVLGAGLAVPLLAACGGAASATVSTGSASTAPATTASLAASSAATTASASTAKATTVASTSSAAASTRAATSTSASVAAATAPAKGKTAVAFWHWAQAYHPGFVKWADQFNATHPTLQVTATVFSTNNNQKITVAIAGGTGPDAYLSDSDGFKNRAFAGLEGPIADLVATDKLAGENLKAMLPSAVQWYTYNGKSYGLPWDYSAGVVLYNLDHLKVAGLTPPAELSSDPAKWNWNTFQQYAAKLTVKQGSTVQRVGGYVSWGCYENSWYSMALANGGSYYNQTLDQCTINSPACVEALDFAVSMAKAGSIATPDSWKAITAQYKNAMEPFTAGAVSMQYTGDWNFKTIEKAKTPVTWDATILPYDPKTGKTGNWSNIRGLVMNPNAKHRAEAFQFLVYLNSAEVQDTITATLGEVPARLDSQQKTYLVPKVAGPPPGRTTLKPALLATVTDGTPYVNEDDACNNMSKAAQAAYSGQKTPQEALNALQQQMQGLINQAKANKK